MSKPRPTGEKARASLHKRGNLLVIIPVAIQLCLIVALWLLSSVGDQSATQSGLQKEKTRLGRTLIVQCQFVSGCIDSTLLLHEPVDSRARFFVERVQENAEKLKADCSGDKAELERLDNIERITVSLLESANHAYLLSAVNGGKAKAMSDGRIKDDPIAAVRSLQDRLFASTSQLQTDLESTPVMASKASEVGRRFWFSLALAGSVINLLSLILAAALFNSAVVKRLARLTENVGRFARGQKLAPAMDGDDEIARLDQNFYQMSSQMHLIESAQKVLFETVDCLLCQVDKLGRFEQTNSAAQTLTGYSALELKGKYIEDLVPVDDRKSAIEFLSKAIQDGSQPPFELPLVKKNGNLVYTLWTARYVPEHKRVFCVVQDATERIEAERVRKQVLQMVSHDLRSPLSSIGLIYKMMDSGHIVALNARGKSALARASASTAEMLTMFSNLLDIEKMEAGMLQLEIEMVNVHDVAAQAVLNVSALAAERKVALDYRQARDRVMADKFRLTQILTNLLNSAIISAPANTQVVVTTQPGNGYLKVLVSNQDTGVDRERQDLRLDQSDTSKLPETQNREDKQRGMGLAICRALVHLHGGEIAFERLPGRGTRYFFSLPDNNYSPENIL